MPALFSMHCDVSVKEEACQAAAEEAFGCRNQICRLSTSPTSSYWMALCQKSCTSVGGYIVSFALQTSRHLGNCG
jgi:hypothetical protein